MRKQFFFYFIFLAMAFPCMSWAVDVTDVLTRDATGVTGSSYAFWSDVKLSSDAVYAGQSAGGNEFIQLRSNNNNSGIISTASSGTVKSITVTWNSNTAAGRTLNIYGSNTAYSDPAELYNADTQGTLLGTIVKGESTTLTIEGDYAFIGMRSNSGAIHLETIEIAWSSSSAPALAAPIFSSKADTYYEPQSVTISCATEGASIYYTTNGTDPTTSSTKYTAPINVSATTTIKAISVKGSEKSAAVSATYTIEELTSLANIAALSAQTEGGLYGVSFKNVVVTYVNGNYAYMQDASGAIVLYKSGHGLTAGQVLDGTAEVTFQVRNGNPQITSLDGVSASDGTAPEPKTVAASSWSTPITTVLSQYFKVTGATITQDGNKYYVQLGSENVQLYGQGDARTISVTDLSTTYTIIGFPTLYNTTPELQIFVQPEAEGAVKPEAGLSYGEGVSTVTVTIGEAYILPTLSNPNNVPVTYSSSETNVATIDATGKVTILGKGYTIIKAVFVGNNNFLAGNASYTLVVKEARVLPDGTFFYETFDGMAGTGGRDGEFSGTVGNGGFNNADGTNITDETWTSTENSGAAAQCAKLGTSSKASVFTTGAIKITGEGSLTFEASGWTYGTNTLTVTATGATLDGDIEITLVNSEWNKYTVSISGAQGEVTITFAGKRGFIDEIKVTNEKATVLKDPELSYGDPTKYDAVFGEPFTAPTLNNPYGVTVTYSSSNEKVATVDASTGAVTLMGAGETTITASSEKTNTYKAGSASYTLNVTVPEIPIEDNDDRFTLVEDYSTLKAGDQVVLVGELTIEADEENGTEASTTYYGMGIKQNNNNREAVKVTYNTDNSISGNTALQTITLEVATDEWLFNVGNGYLYAASSKSNYLRTEEVADDNAKASISAEEGIVFKGENTRNQLRFNPNNGSPLFTCYSSASTMGSVAKIYRNIDFENVGSQPYAVLSEDEETLTFYYDNNRSLRTEQTFGLNTRENTPSWSSKKTYIDTVVFDPSFADARPTTTYDWFSWMFYLETIEGIEYLNTSEVTNMGSMFSGCSNLASLDLNRFDTSKVTNMRYMFASCSSLTSLDLSSFDTSKVTDMNGMFSVCSSLTSLDLSSFDTSKVTNMSYMFIGCSSLTSLDLSSFDTSEVTDMGYMLQYCSNLTSIELSSFNTSKVANMEAMFFGCSSLTTLDLSSFDTSKVINMYQMFYDCSSLTSLDLSNFNTPELTYVGSMFSQCSSLPTFDLSSFNTSKVTNMDYMFSGCSSLTSLNLSSFNTSKVTSMNGMFSSCSSLASLDLSSFNTSKVSSMYRLFSGCSSLTSLDLSHFNTSMVTSMNDIFQGCSSLASLDLSGFKTSKLTNMDKMFYGCSSLIFLDLSSFDTSKVTSMYCMFYDCSSLTSLDLSSFNTSKVTNMSGMFNGCNNIQKLEISDKMSNLYCYGIGTTDYPCAIFAPDSFDFRVDTSGSYFIWNDGYFTLGKEDTESFIFLTIAEGGMITDDSGNPLSNNWKVQKGINTILHITPDDNYEIAQVLLDGNDVTEEVITNNGILTIENVQDDINLSVAFVKTPIFLTINDGSLDCELRLVVEEGKTYLWQITSKDDNEVKAILFNGEDMTEQLSENGILITPAITTSSILAIEYKNKRPQGMDINADGKVTVTDVMIIVNYILGRR